MTESEDASPFPGAAPARDRLLRVTWLMPQPELGGGNKVILQFAQLLHEAGHRVTVLAEGGRPSWTEYSGPYFDIRPGVPELDRQDLVVATFWTTIRRALELDLGPVAHLCQGYEGALEHLAPQLAEIEAAYAQPLPTLVVSPHLADLVATRFGREARVVSPPVDRRFRPRWRLGPRRRAQVVVPGIYEAPVKGVPIALQALARLRRSGRDFELIRISVLPLGDDERRTIEPDRFLCSVDPERVARRLPDCDLLLFPSRPAEGFGLPLLEAMASGVPAVASRIPSVEYLTAGVLPLVDPEDVEAFVTETVRLLDDRGHWRGVRRRGLERSRRFDARRVFSELERALVWAVDWAVDRAHVGDPVETR